MTDSLADVDALPFIDEHAIDIAAEVDDVWEAAFEVGDRLPGFTVQDAARPHLVVLTGRHPFARYAIVLRIEPTQHGSRCRLQSRARFPGLHGRLYRSAVIGTGLHVRAVWRLLRRIERHVAPARSGPSTLPS